MITLPLAPQDPNDVEGTSPSVDFVAVPWWRIDGVRPCIYSRDHCIVAFAGGEVRVKHPAAHVCALVDAAARAMLHPAAVDDAGWIAPPEPEVRPCDGCGARDFIVHRDVNGGTQGTFDVTACPCGVIQGMNRTDDIPF